jgi:hypothetical protein
MPGLAIRGERHASSVRERSRGTARLGARAFAAKIRFSRRVQMNASRVPIATGEAIATRDRST